jgi:hypothetical protein
VPPSLPPQLALSAALTPTSVRSELALSAALTPTSVSSECRPHSHLRLEADGRGRQLFGTELPSKQFLLTDLVGFQRSGVPKLRSLRSSISVRSMPGRPILCTCADYTYYLG